MKITWLGHGSFRLEIADQIILLDPWLEGNPSFPDTQREAAVAGATHILLTHAHDDHATDALALAKEAGLTLVGQYDLVNWWEGAHAIKGTGMNKGGTIRIGEVAVTMVNAVHSSTLRATDGSRICAGSECGFMIAGEGRTIYATGDTDIMADMDWMGDLHKPDIGLLCAGGHFTMDMARAAYAAKRYFDFKTVIPCHYKTFGLLEQSAEVLIAALPDVQVLTPAVMEAVTIGDYKL